MFRIIRPNPKVLVLKRSRLFIVRQLFYSAFVILYLLGFALLMMMIVFAEQMESLSIPFDFFAYLQLFVLPIVLFVTTWKFRQLRPYYIDIDTKILTHGKKSPFENNSISRLIVKEHYAGRRLMRFILPSLYIQSGSGFGKQTHLVASGSQYELLSIASVLGNILNIPVEYASLDDVR